MACMWCMSREGVIRTRGIWNKRVMEEIGVGERELRGWTEYGVWINKRERWGESWGVSWGVGSVWPRGSQRKHHVLLKAFSRAKALHMRVDFVCRCGLQRKTSCSSWHLFLSVSLFC